MWKNCYQKGKLKKVKLSWILETNKRLVEDKSNLLSGLLGLFGSPKPWQVRDNLQVAPDNLECDTFFSHGFKILKCYIKIPQFFTWISNREFDLVKNEMAMIQKKVWHDFESISLANVIECNWEKCTSFPKMMGFLMKKNLDDAFHINTC